MKAQIFIGPEKSGKTRAAQNYFNNTGFEFYVAKETLTKRKEIRQKFRRDIAQGDNPNLLVDDIPNRLKFDFIELLEWMIDVPSKTGRKDVIFTGIWDFTPDEQNFLDKIIKRNEGKITIVKF